MAYFLQQDGASPGWRKANIEGPVYVVKRRVQPTFLGRCLFLAHETRYQIIVKNQFSTSDLIDNLLLGLFGSSILSRGTRIGSWTVRRTTSFTRLRIRTGLTLNLIVFHQGTSRFEAFGSTMIKSV